MTSAFNVIFRMGYFKNSFTCCGRGGSVCLF